MPHSIFSTDGGYARGLADRDPHKRLQSRQDLPATENQVFVGQRVVIQRGEWAGTAGNIFWCGSGRVGIRDDNGNHKFAALASCRLI